MGLGKPSSMPDNIDPMTQAFSAGLDRARLEYPDVKTSFLSLQVPHAEPAQSPMRRFFDQSVDLTGMASIDHNSVTVWVGLLGKRMPPEIHTRIGPARTENRSVFSQPHTLQSGDLHIVEEASYAIGKLIMDYFLKQSKM